MQNRHAHTVNQLLTDSLDGRLSRREVMKRTAALGLSAPLAGIILSAQSVGAQEASPAARPTGGATMVAPSWLRTDLSGQEITVVLGNGPVVTQWEEPAVQIFQDTTGIVVELVEGPQSTTERLTQYLQVFAAGSGDLDAMMVDVIDIGTVGPHAVDLTEAIGTLGAEFFERIVQNNTYEGKLAAIPWFTDAGLLYYRTDLLEKYGFSAAPVTWAELDEMATAILEGESAANPDFEGFVWQGAAYEGLTCDALEWQTSYGGGTIVGEEGDVTVNNEQAVASFEMAAGWVGRISPEGVTTYDEEAARGVWQAGNAAFMRNWPYAFALGQGPDSAIAGMFDVTQIPMGPGEEARHAATLGGWQMMASTYSENQEAAIEFCKFLTSPELQKSFAIEQSRLPTIPALYDDADVLAANPFFGRLKEVFTGAAVARPSTAAGEFYPEVSAAYYTVVNNILNGQIEDAASAVEDLAGEIEGLLG